MSPERRSRLHSFRAFLRTGFEEITAADAQGMHYTLCALATLVLIGRFAIFGLFDLGFGGFVITFWGTAIGNDKLNTPAPTKPTNIVDPADSGGLRDP